MAAKPLERNLVKRLIAPVRRGGYRISHDEARFILTALAQVSAAKQALRAIAYEPEKPRRVTREELRAIAVAALEKL